MGPAEQRRFLAIRPVADDQFVAEGLAVGLERYPRQRLVRGRCLARRFHRSGDPVLRLLLQILPDDRVHQHPGYAAWLRAGQLVLDPVGAICPVHFGRVPLGQCDRGFHPLEAVWHFRPDIALEPGGGLVVSEIDRILVAAAGADDLHGRFRRRQAAPFRPNPHRRIRWSRLHAAQIVMIAPHHRVDPGAGSEFQQFESRTDPPR